MAERVMQPIRLSGSHVNAKICVQYHKAREGQHVGGFFHTKAHGR